MNGLNDVGVFLAWATSLYFPSRRFNPKAKCMDLKDFISLKRETTSFRQLEERVDDLNHVYIWRLAAGERTSPSPETVEKLARALELTPRDAQILGVLSKAPMEDALYQVAQEHPDIPIEFIETAASMSFRGGRPSTQEAWMKVIDFLQSM